MGCLIDEYKLNIFCRCIGCEKYKGTRKDFTRYCEAYSEKIPPRIWNGENVDCKFFKKKVAPVQQK